MIQQDTILRDVTTGVLFRNPTPYLTSVHAYFPSVAVLADGTMVATYVLGEAFEAVNCHLHVAYSTDDGQTWQTRGPIDAGTPGRLTSDTGRVALVPSGQLVVNMARHDRSAHPGCGLSNPANLGFAPTELLLLRSDNGGADWGRPTRVEPPLEGPEFEMCAPIVPLRDGRWLWPTSTWRDWDGRLPNGNRLVALVSHDRGHTWPDYLDVMSSPEDNLRFWESKIIQLVTGDLLAVAWCYDEVGHRDLPNQYAVSHDGGATWSKPQSMQLAGQTLTPLLLPDGRILTVYRRIDRPGLWANLAHLENNRWVNEACQPLWGDRSPEGATATGADMVKNFQSLRFGAPCLTWSADGAIFLAFWCHEQCVGIIRWFKFRVAAA